jgi:hypothetical protein
MKVLYITEMLTFGAGEGNVLAAEIKIRNYSLRW